MMLSGDQDWKSLSPRDQELVIHAGVAIARRRGYAFRKDNWGKGLLGDPIRPLWVGFVVQRLWQPWLIERLPQYAVAIDLEPNDTGDQGRDLIVTRKGDARRLLLSVKSSEVKDYNVVRLRIYLESGERDPLVDKCPFVLFGRSTRECTGGYMTGWKELERLLALPRVKAPAGHWNVELPKSELNPPATLIAAIKKWFA